MKLLLKIAFSFLMAASWYTSWASNYVKLASDRPCLTIWVHGTARTALIPFETKRLHNTCALLPFSKLPTNSRPYLCAQALESGNAQDFATKYFYAFNWSGLLSHKKREMAAQIMYFELCNEIIKIKAETGLEPIVTVITHSHGGNVALILAQINEQHDNKLKIDRLILLACPVQDRTAHLVGHDTFSRIYAFYSNKDFIQVLAMPKIFKLAERKFNNLSNKVIHINTSWARKLFTYVDHHKFVQAPFLNRLSDTLRQLDQDYFDFNDLNNYFVTRDHALKI